MYYLAYGSNLHPLRLALRVPSSRFVAAVRLDGCRLAFEKRGSDGSAKCNLDFTGNADQHVHAVVYEIWEDEVHRLDTVEGLGAGYLKRHIAVKADGQTLPVFFYMASQSHIVEHLEPYDWYKAFVLAGARRHQFPTSYIQQISEVGSKPDPVASRRTEMEHLLMRLQG